MKTFTCLNAAMFAAALMAAGASRAEENAPPRAIDFAAAFKNASTAGAAERIIVADDFERGISRRVTLDPVGNETGYRFDAPAPRLRAYLAVVDPAGKAGLTESTDQAASGSKSIRLEDSPSATPPFGPALSWWLYGHDQLTSGQLKIAFDLLVPETEGAVLEVSARDHTETRRIKAKSQQTHFVLRCSPGLVKLDQSAPLPVSKGQWAHYELVLPLSDAAGKVKLTVTDPRKGIQSVEQPLENIANTVNWIGMMLPGQSEGHVFVDNLVITNSPITSQNTQ